MKRTRRRKCQHCGQLFTPDPRNRHHQHYCSETACRRASKAASQRRWQTKVQNRDYFRDPLHVQRVQAWRQRHPQYWQRKPALTERPLQEVIVAQAIESDEKSGFLVESALQEVIDTQVYVLVGLIAQLTDSALQEEIAATGHRLEQLGRDILSRGGAHEQRAVMPRTSTPTAQSVQLDRSAPGPPPLV